ncbi:hypothetical protein [Hymenobacter sp. YC55]|uniref:hypothetical protein n=1 Tax=Hymenobacter sp. YC55 TaxID=3034019 RepID=UPI0023F7B764|nr:hypothetical protein [Hymenobacter sp. YC55]MDF7815393.1 hypothetical protein [Hymenobacter sp. YC55]
MSHSKSMGSPVNSKASLLGADPARLQDPTAHDGQQAAAVASPASSPALAPAQMGPPEDSKQQPGTQWLNFAGLPQRLTELPSTLRAVGTKTVARWQQLSTPEKVLGGAIVVLGIQYLLSRRR